jgi:hypothetical protein
VPGVEPVLLAKVPPAPPSDHTAEVAPPPNEPPKAGVVAPWHIADNAPPALTVGFGFTVIVLLALLVPHEPPEVVSTKVTEAGDDEEAVYVVVPGVAPVLLAKVPPAPPSDHTAEVAPPPKEPPKAAVVPPWQIAAVAEPALTVGLGLTVKILLAEVVPHEPPEVVNVSVTEPGADADAVYVVVPGVEPLLFVKVPPAPPSDQTAEVAPPPNEPPKTDVVAPWHIADIAPPAFTVGFGFTVIVLLALTLPQEPPAVVRVRVTEATEDAEAV